MSDESPFQGQPRYVTVKTSHKKRWVIIFLVVLLLVITALGALYMLGSSVKHPAPPIANPIPTETIAVTPTPATSSASVTTITPAVTNSPTVDVSALRVSVLNGSGVAGAADKTASALKTAGYSHVTTGNADKFTYTGITVYVKKKEYLPQIQQDIASLNSSAKVTTGVDETISGDVEIIVGK
jgi:LytR cell envelope-related transcriptional attenuator